MVFCNAPLAIKNQQCRSYDAGVRSAVPYLHAKAGRVTVLFVRPGVLALGSKAEGSAKELEDKVIKTIEGGLNAAQ